MTDAITTEPFIDEFHWDDYGSEAPTACTVRYWRYTTASGKEYLQSDESSFAAGVHDFTATSLGSGGFQFISASLATGFQGRRIHREARATGPLSSYPVQPWDGFVTANDEDDLDAELQAIKDNAVGDFDGATDSLRALRDENKAEHDTTQGKVDQIGAAAEARLTGPTTFEIPDTGSSTFVLRFVLRDLDQSPSALVDPGSNQVDVTAIDQSGGAPTGVTLAGSPAGRMTRDSAGRYSLVVTVDSNGVDETQLRFTADYTYLGTSNVALHDTILGDFDQLDHIESNTDTLLTRVGTASDAIDDPTLFGQHYDTQSDIAAEHATTRTHVTTEHNATRALITDVQAGTRLRYSWSSVGDAGIDGGLVRFRVNLTDDTGGDISTGGIDISSASATLERSRAAAAFTTTGVTQPTVTKETGAAVIEFDLVGTEWKPGDEAHLTLKGVKASGRFIPAASWLFQPNAAGTYTPDYST